MERASRKGLLQSALLLRLQQMQQQAQTISNLREKRQEVFTVLAAERARQEIFIESYVSCRPRTRCKQRSYANLSLFAASVDVMLDEIDSAIVEQSQELQKIDDELSIHRSALLSLEAQREQLKAQLQAERRKERAEACAVETADAAELSIRGGGLDR